MPYPRKVHFAFSYSAIVVLSSLVLSLGSCQPGDPGVVDLWGDSLIFQTDFPVVNHLSGVCQCTDPKEMSECVYFADAVTNKQILLFSANGTLLHTVPLGPVLDSLKQIGGISILHTDTIVLCGAYNNRIAIIDRDGRCYRIADLSEQLARSEGLAYELSFSFFSPFMVESAACFRAAVVPSSISAYRGVGAPTGDEMYTYAWLSRNSPQFASFDLNELSDEPHLRWGPVLTERDTVHEIPLIEGPGSYACLNGMWFVYTINSPVIEVFHPVLMEPTRQFSVHSEFTSTYRKPVMLPKGGTLNLQDSLNDHRYNGGFIETVHFDRPSSHYLVVLRHRLVKSPQENAAPPRGGYSVLEYDDDFNFIKETAITDGLHRLPFMICLSSGTFVMRSESKRERMHGVHTFDRLSLSGN